MEQIAKNLKLHQEFRLRRDNKMNGPWRVAKNILTLQGGAIEVTDDSNTKIILYPGSTQRIAKNSSPIDKIRQLRLLRRVADKCPRVWQYQIAVLHLILKTKKKRQYPIGKDGLPY